MKLEELKKPLVNVGHLLSDPEYPTGHDECIMCNRAIRGQNKFSIHACNGGVDEICSNEDNDYVEKNDSGDMGNWSVGSVCVKKLRADLKDQGVNPDDYIYSTAKPKAQAKAKAKTKSWSMTEEDTLILWRALQVYRSEIDDAMGNPLAKNNDLDYERATMLLAKAVHKSCDFAGTLEEGETVKSIYETMV
jgi:hypothetical protein